MNRMLESIKVIRNDHLCVHTHTHTTGIFKHKSIEAAFFTLMNTFCNLVWMLFLAELRMPFQKSMSLHIISYLIQRNTKPYTGTRCCYFISLAPSTKTNEQLRAENPAMI